MSKNTRNYIIVVSVLIAAVALASLILIIPSHGESVPRSGIPASVKAFMVGKDIIKVDVEGLKYCGTIPKELSCDVPKPQVPKVRWTPVEGAKSYALVVMDPDAPIGTFYHLVAYNIRDHEWPSNSTLGPNSAGYEGWFPVCPPKGDKAHRYFFVVIALKEGNLPPGLDSQELLKVISKESIAYGFTCGKYKR